MNRLIVASNRVADPGGGAQSGGLAVGIGDALRDLNGLWFGWNGETVAEEAGTGMHLERRSGVAVATQPLTREEYECYYLGYSNRALWPVLHYRLDLAQFDTKAFTVYREVNRRFARALAALIQPGDVVWIHDYHLIPLGAELRAVGITNRLGFFLHIPFPPPELISALPDHEWLIDTLFACDVIGFQTDQDLENFRRYLEQTEDRKTPEVCPYRCSGRSPLIRTYPIGIDVDAFAAMANTQEAQERIRRLARETPRTHIIGVDRLDYSKGLPDRFRAFQRFLERYPEHRKQAVLMQIAPPTREELSAYSDIRTELERLSGAINGAYGDFDWTPVRYIHRLVSRDTLAALFRGSQIGLVTPLRDGMNLVAKEYIAAQDPEDPGVLVLSQFAGAAADLREAIIVNPYDADEVAQSLHQALTMPAGERRERHAALLQRIRDRDAANWRRQFLEDLRGDAAEASPRQGRREPGPQVQA
ncbi:MAG TPA: trehalose-6-phosphate synthase [Paracoccaceae bacterium]|nr:trehalose-6-phosphate synthase [Paracoccaceae bacterium]